MSTSDAPNPVSSEPSSAENASDVADFRELIRSVRREVGRVFIGSQDIVDGLMIALFANGHVLLEGVPGVAKTTLVRAFARTLDASFKRIQFTPDLLPSDITGVYLPNLQTQEFVLRKGPIFANVILGDEINRAPAKTQAALLEAMQERQVTIEGTTHALPMPFLVLATQNPVEQEGVYALPEAQLDRFLLKMTIDYPSADDELRVLQTHHVSPEPVPSVFDAAAVARIRSAVDAVHVSEELARYIVRLTRFTRDHPQTTLGVSPRAGLALLRASKSRAVIHERDFVLPDDIRALARPVFVHRILLQPEAELGGLRTVDIVEQALAKVRYSMQGPG